ncbi:hypothetical protein LG047_19180 [Methylocystis sp. WRRC1]|uniref:hypothetical protein n=1 Tax=Methylocystis sp. WRRC1 TaxID=1732014 RepID=UPI001D13A77F|nr:hypothetical protein [Methylocystis sp. WRRC1]MCC3247416.1 hypothetical protein [Methylocystis sp. WRRC1]
MSRNETRRAARTFASRPVRVAVAMKIAFIILAANVSFAAAKAIFAKAPEAAAAQIQSTSPSMKPFILSVSAEEPAVSQNCHEVEVETDEGYGVRGHVTRTVCRSAL